MTTRGSLRLEMGGEWDIDDLESISASLRLSYGYFYWVTQDPEKMESAVRTRFERYFWSGERVGPEFAVELYGRIPAEERLRLVSIHYSSPGWLVVAGVAVATRLLAACVSAWAKAGQDVVDLFERIDRFFEERKLRKIPRRVDVGATIQAKDLDDARKLCDELAPKLGFSQRDVDKLIDLTGNPISSLRLMVALSNESRRMLEMEEHGKLKLPRKSIED